MVRKSSNHFSNEKCFFLGCRLFSMTCVYRNGWSFRKGLCWSPITLFMRGSLGHVFETPGNWETASPAFTGKEPEALREAIMSYPPAHHHPLGGWKSGLIQYACSKRKKKRKERWNTSRFDSRGFPSIPTHCNRIFLFLWTCFSLSCIEHFHTTLNPLNTSFHPAVYCSCKIT